VPSEREGYVPNVVYTRSLMQRNDQIGLPYAVSDKYSNFATVEIAALLQSMEIDRLSRNHVDPLAQREGVTLIEGANATTGLPAHCLMDALPP
jgi:predicted GH43/DUF377 family glycosyl hydrolase